MFETGFYWVKTATVEGVQEGIWEPAMYDAANNEWQIIGQESPVETNFFDEIGEKLCR